MQIIPAIDILEGKVVRLRQGNFSQRRIYSDDPLSYAKYWQKEGAKMLHLVDLDGAKTGNMKNLSIIKKILNEITIPIQVGGGVNDESTIIKLLNLNVARIILGTVAMTNEVMLKNLLAKFKSKIIIGFDVRKEKIAVRGWQENIKDDVLSRAKSLERLGVGRLIYTDITKDGTLSTPNFKSIKKLVMAIKIPVIVSGGISTVMDVKKIKKIGAEGVIIGKALYEGKINLKEAINAG
ncbi:1-(5-phosphoribosyl)-5-[(5-phosphoribosylamino)methylideneamino]imidazole-4-carboxamide isomerase [Candidatus Gottesmanbacteria bacterium RIFCSPLOWO2_01_FULL_39_12b]|uniref:1-(5-phosphoribosyl)-5-[(5-phosphoribosylamino)methylideneamino] imidazole-4-carboxamide isomerase n=1 Tax=Candidatus Gottesmanbacteria bacterium RIFCSPLOWO2_01_FULL_39_12b TaxID=1798388 RepID=A0A1F6ASS8_9BACT|nr:MAG: 1-(5-phosphoribosyl)-5-[(5-phosphoribosylamino)methylideneamino]imidazole-4-carboxamide isomerase [Candidatus Gottesmanbacteria bacterium RIFCSPLOWO2_01_FULL_39_12b]